MRIAGLALLAAALPLAAQDPATVAGIDEAFQLTGVRILLESLPAHVKEMTASAVALCPRDLRQQLEPNIQDVSQRFVDTDAFYRDIRVFFLKHYDSEKMTTLLALERTPAYRTMHRLQAAAETAAAEAGRRRFDANLKADPPAPQRVAILQRLDDAMKTTDLQVRITTGIMNVIAGAMGAQMPADLASKLQPILASRVLSDNLYTFRNAGDSDLEDYVAAAQQPAVEWFNRSLQSAVLAVAAERTKAKVAHTIK